MSLPTGLKSEKEIQTLEAGYQKTKTMDEIIPDCARFMDAIMRGVANEQYNVGAVNAACNCAKQVYLLCRLALEMKSGKY